MSTLRAATFFALLAATTSIASSARADTTDTTITLLDDGERIARDPASALPASPYPDVVELFALRGEVVAFQVALESQTAEPRAYEGKLGPFLGGKVDLGAKIDAFSEYFVEIKRTSASTRGSGLAWATNGQPDPAVLGFQADALIPNRPAQSKKGERGALWFDVTIPEKASPGMYESTLLLTANGAEVGKRTVRIRVLDAAMPYAAHAVMAYYDPPNLDLRMGGRTAEAQLRALLHAHHVGSFHTTLTMANLEADEPYLSGAAYDPSKYSGPGAGRGEGVVVLGAYGDLGEPAESKIPLLAQMVGKLDALKMTNQAFLYAVDEDCASPWPAAWRQLLDANPATKALRVGATCYTDPRSQKSDVVMTMPESLNPEAAEAARAAGKQVWAYNGKRPFGGPMVIDTPAVDLRANAWIAERHGIPRWFYWEVSSWTRLGGGKTTDTDTDPYTVAESFRNRIGDYSNGDGILVYPGKQVVPGMVDFGQDEVFPSVRLKNIRRGVQDAGYIQLSRAKDRAKADAVVERIVPVSMRAARGKAAWPTRGKDFLDARRELAEAFVSFDGPAPPQPPAANGSNGPDLAAEDSGGCSTGASGSSSTFAFGALVGAAFVVMRRRRAA
jgi:MYXO-CTERM domain-containing protein